MGTRIFWEKSKPYREGLSQDETWNGIDKGLIKCWEVGRKLAQDNPELSEKARNGELPSLNWKGGTDKKLKKKRKYGTLNYLAKWQGLRGDDLDIELDSEIELVCTKTGLAVTYTGDSDKYKEP